MPSQELHHEGGLFFLLQAPRAEHDHSGRLLRGKSPCVLECAIMGHEKRLCLPNVCEYPFVSRMSESALADQYDLVAESAESLRDGIGDVLVQNELHETRTGRSIRFAA